MATLRFKKMHGLGNDFVVLDARDGPVGLGPGQVRAIADRRRGIGCDQLLTIEPPANGRADAFMRIHNADGGEAGACGNGLRCVARLLMAESGNDSVRVETVAGVLEARAEASGEVTVDMGSVGLEWQDIPLAGPADTLSLDLSLGPLSAPVAVSIGNPHAVFFVDDAEAILLDRLGPELERHDMFPEDANIGVAAVIGPDRLRYRVWERGVGITRACGSGACAAAVAAHRRGLAGRRVRLTLDGGDLAVEWHDSGRVSLTGPTAESFSGEIGDDLLAGARHA